MTIEEAIKAIELNRPTSGYTILCEALDMAVAALREHEGMDNIKGVEIDKERLPEEGRV